MTQEEQLAADTAAAAAAGKTVEEIVAERTAANPDLAQDLLKKELEKKQSKSGFTKLEKARHAAKKIQDEIAKLEEDEGITPGVDADDDEPVTVGMLKQKQKEEATKNALNLADAIENETERELVKHHLENSIRPTGNPAEDLRLARALVNDVKNQQIIEEVQRKKDAAKAGTGSGAPARKEGEEFVPTAEEERYMKPPFNLTKEQIIAARPKA